MQNDVDNEYMQKAEETVAVNLEKNSLVRLGHLMPWLVPLLKNVVIGLVVLQRLAHKWIPNIEEMPRFWLLDHAQHLIDARTSSLEKDSDRRRIDLLQLMLNAATRGEVKVSLSIYSYDDNNAL
jgi:hypothetical protein